MKSDSRLWQLLLLCILAGACAISIAAPQIRCDISLTTWCITQYDGFVSMQHTDSNRIWTLRARGSSSVPPMRRIESSDCSDFAEEKMRLVASSKKRSKDGSLFQHTEYSLNSNGCKLEFELPIGSSYQAYRQFMLYGILVGYNKRVQLFKLQR